MAVKNNNADNVAVGKPKSGGAVFVAPKGTALPTDATSTLNDAFANTGYISEDGVSNEIETDSEEIKAWGGDIVATPQTSYSEKYSMTFIEQREEPMKIVFGAENVTSGGNGALTVKHNSVEKDEFCYVIETLIGKNKIKRTVIPRGKCIEVGEIVYKDDEAVGYETTVQALPDAEGNTSYEYTALIVGA